ncbi:copper chaperone PCu(A)C [Micrococcus sp.]|uniref:copper chaperone PCu(A)C n=1 Tax=Micrococcus sp. TaxID=1271 RepID=UPI002A90C510|nr:copper chaperone PCu(A)C [Micrococcus sp.]MDY6054884.1 copper chaperone PCu(A)C [Micrococcus sp.]
MTTQNTLPSTRRLSLATVLAAGALGLTACAGSGESAPASAASSAVTASPSGSESTGGAASATASEDAPLTMTDPWTKATDGEMTGSFGILENTSDQDVHVVSVTSSLTDRVELHEMVPDEDGQMLMQQTPDGFTVPAGETFELTPGGNHVMLMGLTEPIQPGDEVTYELETEDGAVLEVTSVARPFTGANESYHGGEASGAMEGGHGDH